MEKLALREAVGASVERAPKFIQDTINQMVGRYKVEHWRDGKLLQVVEGKNTILNGGKNKLLDVMFNAVTAITPWYIGLVDNASFSAIAAADTPASHAGWIEATYYSESVRQTWGVGSAASQSITNGTAATFTINSNSKTVQGIFVTSLNTKSGTTGTMWCATVFSSPIAVNSGDLLKVTYTVSC